MSLNKLFIVFGIILVIFAGIIFFQFNTKASNNSSAPKSTVKINNRTFNVEVMDTPDKQQQGLSGRKSIPQNQGMLFVFDEKSYHYFWMKNMNFPIDIIFIEDDKIVSIVKSAPPAKTGEENPPLYKSGGSINRVLEINSGLSDKYKFKAGDKVEIKL